MLLTTQSLKIHWYNISCGTPEHPVCLHAQSSQSVFLGTNPVSHSGVIDGQIAAITDLLPWHEHLLHQVY